MGYTSNNFFRLVEEYEDTENYLETVLMLRQRKGFVRSIDIANEMGFSKPSVSIAMKNLKENGYITIDDGGMISLTDKGREIAEKTYERHTLFTEWLIRLGVSPDVAAEDACRMEHAVSEESFAAIKNFVQQNITEEK
jgi:DtxR family Mn-dependent transcriptional regulator